MRNEMKKFLMFMPAILLVAVLAAAAGADDGTATTQPMGNGPTGAAGAWLFIFAALPPAANIITRHAKKSQRITERYQKMIKAANTWIREYLRHLHYWLNPLALIVIGVHWMLGHCGRFSLQQYMWVLLLLWALGGLTLKMGWAPAKLKPKLFKLHGFWPVPLAMFLVVALGHALT